MPASFISDVPHLREKTSKIGLIGRAAAIFGVNEIIIFQDSSEPKQSDDANVTTSLLSYMETPQYLRKRLFKIRPELQYAGILPPLRTPHHPLQRRIKDLKIDEYREGVTLSTTERGTTVDVGVEKPAILLGKKLPSNQRVTARITAINNELTVRLADRSEIDAYWGFHIESTKSSFPKLIKGRTFDLTVATSRLGKPFPNVATQIREKWREAAKILVAFGSPSQGLYEMARKEGLALENIVDFTVNTIPYQGTQTVRTEEALMASLAVFQATFAT